MRLGEINLNAITLSTALIAIEALAVPAFAASIPTDKSMVAQSSETALIAQAENCRQVSAPIGGLRVMAEPSVYSASVGVVADGRNVTIQNLGADGWVPITAPLEGYIPAEFLTTCNLTLTNQEPALRVANEPDSCMMVVARRGLNIRNEPSINGDRVGGLRNGAVVTIEELTADGWAELAEPLEGYVAANYLAPCP